MACRQHGDRGIAGVAGDSQAEGSKSTRDCRISVEQGRAVMRMLEGKAAEAYVCELECRSSRVDEVAPVVRGIVEDVRWNGDLALRKYALNFDGLHPNQSLRVSERELGNAWKEVSGELRAALGKAEKNIRQFCEWQKPKPWTRSRKGISLAQIVRPLDSVACYVPGGRFPLVSTLLMTVIPAQVAGVKHVRMMSPRPSLEVLAAASLLGVREFYRIGGAQAIAALAYGTETIPHVDKIVGPGNLYVTAAKKLVSFDCPIDMLAGPTEVVIVSDHGNPAFIAADLLAQAEHDPETLASLITTSERLAAFVVKELKGNERKSPAGQENAVQSIAARGAVLMARSRQEAFNWANRIAAEHITVEK